MMLQLPRRIGADDRDSSKNAIGLGQAGITLPSRDYCAPPHQRPPGSLQ
jgi:hypothetical protein